jgi:transcriptional regulator GlxA family with amidase domain
MNSKVRSLISFFEANLHRQIKMAEIIVLADLSPSRGNNLFKAEFGKSPGQYLKELRMQKARLLLESTPMKIKQVRLAVGYRDHRHFFQDFKKRFGLTPSEYREHYLNAAVTETEARRKQ